MIDSLIYFVQALLASIKLFPGAGIPHFPSVIHGPKSFKCNVKHSV